jgi:hypothetical protein
MSKSNVNPNHYKVAGRERQGEDIAQVRNKQMLAESLVRRRYEPDARFQKPAPVQEPALPAAAPTPAPKEKNAKTTRPATAKRATTRPATAKRATAKAATAKRAKAKPAAAAKPANKSARANVQKASKRKKT